MKKNEIGVVGLGAIGEPLSRRFAEEGYRVHIWNRTASKAADLVQMGAILSETPRALASECRQVILALTDEAAIRQVIFGEGGLAEGLTKGATIIDTSTIGPEAARKLARELSALGIKFLDAPVSGGAKRARDGTLCVMVGGDVAAFKRSKGVLRLVGSDVHYMGESGSGQSAKLVNQVLVSINALAAAESLILAASLGLDMNRLFEVIKMSSGDSNMFRVIAASFTEGDFDPDQFIRLMKKDLDLILREARRSRSEMPVSRKAARIYSERHSREGNKADVFTRALRKR